MAAVALPHLFCCVIPAVLTLLSLVAPASRAVEIIPESWEPWVFVFSGVMLVASWLFVLRGCKCECAECASPPRHHIQKIILWVATAIFAISLVIHIL